MLQIVSAAAEVGRCQKLLEGLLSQALPRMMPFTAGRRGASHALIVHTDGDLWYGARLVPEHSPIRYWNAFGLMSNDPPTSIIVEINFPLYAVDRRVSGMFANDCATGTTLLLHRGGIGGGRRGIGKRAFLDWYRRRRRGRLVAVAEGGPSPTEAILIGSVGRRELVEGLYDFVHDVQDFKTWATRTSAG